MRKSNEIGDQGESIFKLRLTKTGDFRVYFLGEKAPLVDYLIEVEDSEKPYFAMVQVKSTKSGYLKKGNLKAKLKDTDRDKLISLPLPTYLAGVDTDKESVYINPVFSSSVSYQNSIPVKNILKQSSPKKSDKTLAKLKNDIVGCWNHIYKGNSKSSYNSKL